MLYYQGPQYYAFDHWINYMAERQEMDLMDARDIIASKDYHAHFHVHKNLVELEHASDGEYKDSYSMKDVRLYPCNAVDEVSHHSSEIGHLQEDLSPLIQKMSAMEKKIDSMVAQTEVRTIKLMFKDEEALLANGMTGVPTSTAFRDFQRIISDCLQRKLPGRTVVRIEWEGVEMQDDQEVLLLKQKDVVVVYVRQQ
eukprot:TRINITY_DN5864_c0_g1_i2.p1 TRINITY_DN5864_c0_g1~~TRINITY_DN5864_c0_g1_i2.p1  ORF type:complete len:197 (+),score=8.08 TRINITY_DN5864_c0_g1_i2:342-932(+)